MRKVALAKFVRARKTRNYRRDEMDRRFTHAASTFGIIDIAEQSKGV